MSTEIKTVVDAKRGCGWRKPGGLYLRCDGISTHCGKMPVPLGVCPCCAAGIKQARGWTWIVPGPFLAQKECAYALDTISKETQCGRCIMDHPPAKAGLLWIGEKFYPKPQDWTDEGHKLGVSRRINTIPKGFVIGMHWVFVAHPKAVTLPDTVAEGQPSKMGPGIFHAFRPDRIEYVTTGKETSEQLAALAERGITPVKVLRNTDLKGLE
jgi:hypothetical protein